MTRLIPSLWLFGAVLLGYNSVLLQQTRNLPTSVERLVEARTVLPILDIPDPTLIPGPQRLGVERVALRSDSQSIALPDKEKQPASLPTVPEAEREITLVAVIRAATVHSGPSVSAPIVRYYPVGTELHLVDLQRGWFQVLDPATEQSGWVYERYYLQEIRRPGQTITAAQQSPSPSKSNPVRQAQRLGPPQTKKIKPRIQNVRRQTDSVANLVERAFRGY
jgi:Bacterial SH3 domain